MLVSDKGRIVVAGTAGTLGPRTFWIRISGQWCGHKSCSIIDTRMRLQRALYQKVLRPREASDVPRRQRNGFLSDPEPRPFEGL